MQTTIYRVVLFVLALVALVTSALVSDRVEVRSHAAMYLVTSWMIIVILFTVGSSRSSLRTRKS